MQISQKITAKIGIKGYPGQVGGSTLGVLTPVFLATNVGGVRMKKPKFGNFGIRAADLVPYPFFEKNCQNFQKKGQKTAKKSKNQNQKIFEFCKRRLFQLEIYDMS